MKEMWVQSLDWEDTLEKVMATYSKIPWTEEPGGLQAMGLQRAWCDWAAEHVPACTHTHTHHVSETCNYSDKIVTKETFSLLVTCHSRSQCKNRRKKYPWGYYMWRSWCLPHWSKLQWINWYKMLLYWVKRGD